MDDKKIIEEIIAGNRDAYRSLVERYQTGLIIHCENLLKNRASGEDIAQESFIKAYQTLQKFDENKGRFSTWLYKIATNKCIDELRKQKRTVDIDDVEQLCAETTAPMYNDEAQMLREAVELLEPPEYSRVIKAYYWEGKSYEQIARELNIKSQTVGTWLHRAKIQLKEALV
ncbi:MAG TPA: RNA polymerase sigma factor [Candidatus Saccharibacteria bacterium]|nr:RNA polymerase sigma factor [Candidatus Saccharibacteria bacterium]